MEAPQHSETDRQFLESTAEEAASLFPAGKVHSNPGSLREEVKAFACKKGFAVGASSSKVACTRAPEPQANKNKRERRPPVPAEKQRKRTSTRCGCEFRIQHCFIDSKSKVDKSIRITNGSHCTHNNGCLPSREQLAVERRKGGQFTASIHEHHIKTTLTMTSKPRITGLWLRIFLLPW